MAGNKQYTSLSQILYLPYQDHMGQLNKLGKKKELTGKEQ